MPSTIIIPPFRYIQVNKSALSTRTCGEWFLGVCNEAR